MITCCSRVHSVPFVTLAICRVFWDSTTFMSHTWCHSHSPILVLPSGQGHFPMMEAGGSPFPHNDSASMDGGTMVMAGTVVSSTCCSEPTGGSTLWGPTSMGSEEFNYSPRQNIQRTCVTEPSFPGCLAECSLSNVRVHGGLPLIPFMCGRAFSLLSFIFTLLSEVVQL